MAEFLSWFFWLAFSVWAFLFGFLYIGPILSKWVTDRNNKKR